MQSSQVNVSYRSMNKVCLLTRLSFCLRPAETEKFVLPCISVDSHIVIFIGNIIVLGRPSVIVPWFICKLSVWVFVGKSIKSFSECFCVRRLTWEQRFAHSTALTDSLILTVTASVISPTSLSLPLHPSLSPSHSLRREVNNVNLKKKKDLTLHASTHCGLQMLCVLSVRNSITQIRVTQSRPQ